MRVRHADPARDAGRCAEIYAPSVSGTAASFEVLAPGAAEMAMRIERTSRRWPWLVAEQGGQVLGYAYGSSHRDRLAYRWAVDVSVYVDAAHHGRGIARSLYGALLSRLAAQGFHEACAGIALPNPASVRLHEAVGFRPVGVYREIGFKLGRWWDVGWWQLTLRERSDGTPAEPGAPLRLPP